MFTGIIEEVGSVRSLRSGVHSAVLTIDAHEVLEGTVVGDSVAVNGVCLTVTALSHDGFVADVMHETLNRSTLGGLQPGSLVNLERAMPADGRFGGHIVSGHIDGVGRITAVRDDDQARWYSIIAEPPLWRLVVEKGSIAVDGISLTVASVEPNQEGGIFLVSLIPYTQRQTTLSERRPGDYVNLETDIIGKYVERLLSVEEAPVIRGGITEQFLLEHGFKE